MGINLLPTPSASTRPVAGGAAPRCRWGPRGRGSRASSTSTTASSAGENGTETEEQSPSGVTLPGSTTAATPSEPGTGIELTIDEPLQYVTEQSLGAEIVGVARQERDRHRHEHPHRRHPGHGEPGGRSGQRHGGGGAENLALTQVYEPGSVFKLVTFSAALQDGIITPSEVFTVPNTLTIDGWVFHDAESHPTEQLSATQILAQSSNIGTIEIAQQLGEGPAGGADRHPRIRRAHRARLPGRVGRAGEERTRPRGGLGHRFHPDRPGRRRHGPAGPRHGQHGGHRRGVRPAPTRPGDGGHRRVGHGDTGRARPTGRSPRRCRRELTTMMEQVVQDGTAVTAGVPGYTVAGKTGTAQIPDPVHGGYIPGAYMATFAGFAPAENPALSAIVVLEPAHADLRRDGGRPGVLPDHAVRAAPLRHPHLPGGGTTGRPGRPDPVPTATHGHGHRDRPQSTAAERRAGHGGYDRRFRREDHGRAVIRPGGAPTVRMDRLLEEVEVVEDVGDVAGTEVTSIEFDSRRVRPGALFCCLPGHARRRPRLRRARPWPRGAVALLVERPLDLDVPQAVVAPGAARPVDGPGGLRLLRTSGPVAHDRRGDRDERQDHGHPPAGRRSSRRTAGRRTVIGTLDGARTTPEAPVLQRLLAEARDAGAAGGGHGGVLARPGPGAGGRDPLRRGGVHQPVPRPSRLPRDHGGLLRGQGVAVHPRTRRRWPWSTWTTPGAGGSSSTARVPMVAVLDADEVERRRERPRCARPSRGGAGGSSWPWPGASTWPTPWPRPPRPRPSGCPTTSWPPGWPGPAGAGAVRGGGGGGAVHRRRRLRPHPRRAARWRSTAPGVWPAGQGSCASSGAAGTATGPSDPLMGAVAAALAPTSPSSPRTTPAARIPTPSSTTSCRGVATGPTVIVEADRRRGHRARPWTGRSRRRGGGGGQGSRDARSRSATERIPFDDRRGGGGARSRRRSAGGTAGAGDAGDQPHGLGRHRPVGRPLLGTPVLHPMAGAASGSGSRSARTGPSCTWSRRGRPPWVGVALVGPRPWSAT